MFPRFSLLTSLILPAAFSFPAAAQQQLWMRQLGTSAPDYANALAPDSEGGVYTAGHTRGSLGGPHAGVDDAWMARYDSAGTRLWVWQHGTAGYELVEALAPDAAGGVFVAGGQRVAAPAPNVMQVWVSRYDSAGGQIWSRVFGTAADDYAGALTPDGAGGMYVGGMTGGSLGAPHAGAADVWLARFDGTGTQLWIRQFGTSDFDFVTALAPDGAGGMFAAGRTHGSLGGPNAGAYDPWLARYDGNGNRLWIRQFGTGAGDAVQGLAPDGGGGVYVGGPTEGSLGGPSVGGADAWLARYDGDGSQLWIRQFGTGGPEDLHGLAPDNSGGVYAGGVTGGNLGGPAAGGGDAWLARYDDAGHRLWIRQFGSEGGDYVYAVASDAAGSVFTAGYTTGSLGGAHAGLQDAWIARWTSGPAPCYPNCDNSTTAPTLNIADFICFTTKYAAADPYANCDNSTVPPILNVADFICYQSAFATGCP